MRGPNGTIYPMTGTYRELLEPARLVFLSVVPDERGNSLFEVLNTVTFAEQAGKTVLTLEARVLKKTPDAEKYLAGMEADWNQSLERLGERVTKGM